MKIILVLKNAKTFVCRIINLSSNQFNIPELESSMEDMISKFSHARVELENPDITVYLIFTDEEIFLDSQGELKQKTDQEKLKTILMHWIGS